MGEPTPVAVNQDMVVEAAKAVLDQVVETAIGPQSDTSTEGVKIQRAIAEGPAATVLREAAEGADLLVVGTRGRGGFSGLLLGSVSSQCVHHAPCPVVVVPPEEDQTAEG
jgi:nucleotide-binding universal stress UspA family protein